MPRTLTLLGIVVLTLLAIGFVLLASAGETIGVRRYHDAYYFVTQQAKGLCVALVFLAAAAFFDYHKWRQHPWLTILVYVAVVGLMAAVFLFPETKGSHRWIKLGSKQLQPSELAKIMSVIATAVFLDRAGWRIEKFWKGALPGVAIVGVLMGLAVAEPDFGATMVIALAGGMMCLIGGMKFVHMGIMGLIGLAGVGTLLAFNRNRMNRIAAWLPDSVASMLHLHAPDAVTSAAGNDAGYQLDQALVAIRNGGLTGVGFGRSMQKQYYLPEAHTDFIFAIGAEEWGLIFSIALLVLFTIFFVCGILISMRAKDDFGRLLAFGMTFLIFFQVLFNIGVVTGCLPTKGLALPFISYGGSNMITAMIAVGILFNVGRQIELPKFRPRSTISPDFA